MPILDSCIVTKPSNYGAPLSMSVYPQHCEGNTSRLHGELRRVFAPSGTLSTETGNSTFYSKSGMQHIASSKASGMDAGASEASTSGNFRSMTSRSISDKTCPRFPKLQECAHFHYERVELSGIQVTLYDGSDRSEVEPITALPPDVVTLEEPCLKNRYCGLDDIGEDCFFTLSVRSNRKTWLIRRTFKEVCTFDQQLHKCIYDRGFSQLMELSSTDDNSEQIEVLKADVTVYLARFSQLAGNLINCAPILKWLELDNRGHRLVAFDDESAINTPAVAAVHVTKRYMPQAGDELALEVGDMISVIDMPPRDESFGGVWWRGKKELDVGFFPSDCVEVIAGHNIPSTTGGAGQSTRIPVLRRRGKLTAFFRSFLSNRPPRRRLKESGILKERVYGCDLGEHLLNTGQKVPAVLIHCSTFIEDHGIVDGVYRLSGVSSNIQRLRLEFDAEKVPDLTQEVYMQDIHSVSSVLKLYFRELPIPLLTYQLYDKFVYAVSTSEETRLLHIHDVVNQLPPPHFRTLEFLMRHLARVAASADKTGMNSKNLAIVWAPNLLRSSEMENSVEALKGVGVCAIAVEYLIRYADLIFSSRLHTSSLLARNGNTPKCLNRPKSLAVSTPTKLLNMQEARALGHATAFNQKFIEVGEGPSNLPKYHTVIDLPSRNRRRNGDKGSLSDSQKSPSGWRNLFGPKQRKQNWPPRSRLDLTVGILGASTLPNMSPQDPKTSDSSSTPSDANTSSFKRRKLRSSGRANSENMCSLPCVFENPRGNLASTPKDPPPIRRVPLVTLNQITGEGSATPNRSTSHESFFEAGNICDGFSRKIVQEPRTVNEVVRTVPCNLVEGGCLVKLNFMDCTHNSPLNRFSPVFSIRHSVIEEHSSTDDLCHPPVNQDPQRTVPVELHNDPTAKLDRDGDNRLHRTLSPTYLRKYRAQETALADGKGFNSPGASRLKRSLSTSPVLARRQFDNGAQTKETLGSRLVSQKSEKDKSRRKSLRRMTLEETVDSTLSRENSTTVSLDEPGLSIEYNLHASQDETSQRFSCLEMELFDAICAEIYQEVPGPDDIQITSNHPELNCTFPPSSNAQLELAGLKETETRVSETAVNCQQLGNLVSSSMSHDDQSNRQSTSSGEFSPTLAHMFTTPRPSLVYPDVSSSSGIHNITEKSTQKPSVLESDNFPSRKLDKPPFPNEATTSAVYFYGLTSHERGNPVEETEEKVASPVDADVMVRSIDLKALRDTFFGLPSSHDSKPKVEDERKVPSVGCDAPLGGPLKVQTEAFSYEQTHLSDATSFTHVTKTFDMIDLHGDAAWKENAEAVKAITGDDHEMDASSASYKTHLTGNNNDRRQLAASAVEKENGVDAVEYLLLLRKASLSPNEPPTVLLPSATSQINDEENHDSVSMCSNTDEEKISVRSLRCKFENGKRKPVTISEPTSTVDCLVDRLGNEDSVPDGGQQSRKDLAPRESLKQKLYTLSNMYRETSSSSTDSRIEDGEKKNVEGRSELSVRLKPAVSSGSSVQSVRTFPLTRPALLPSTFSRVDVDKPANAEKDEVDKKPSIKVREMRRMYENGQVSNEHEQRNEGSDSPPSSHQQPLQRSGKVTRLKTCQQVLSSL